MAPLDLRMVSQRFAEVDGQIVTVRSGTIVSDLSANVDVLVTLDNDPSGAVVSAQGLNYPLASGTRVQLLAYPARGLVVLGALSDPLPPTSTPYVQVIFGPTAIPEPTDPRIQYIDIEAVGGGGGGGGAQITAAGQSALGSGGGSGMWCHSAFRIIDLTWPLSATGGAAGTGSAGANGTAGGASFVQHSPAGVPTDLIRAPGGNPGVVLGAGAVIGNGSAGGNGVGVGFVGQAANNGGDGEGVVRLIAAGPNMAGHGGASFYGGGGQAGQNNSAGGAAQPVGAGGGGANNSASQTAKAGGGGQVGWVLYKFY